MYNLLKEYLYLEFDNRKSLKLLMVNKGLCHIFQLYRIQAHHKKIELIQQYYYNQMIKMEKDKNHFQIKLKQKIKKLQKII